MKLKPIAFATALALCGAVAAWNSEPSHADPPPPAAVTATPPATVTVANPQQNRMKQCQADATAKGLKGADRQSFVNTCLKSKPAVMVNAQQQKMKTCQAEATAQGLKGAERTSYLSSCLKSH